MFLMQIYLLVPESNVTNHYKKKSIRCIHLLIQLLTYLKLNRQIT